MNSHTIRFRASAMLALWFFWAAFGCLEAHAWVNLGWNLVIAVCLTSCWLGRPIRLGKVIEFSGW